MFALMASPFVVYKNMASGRAWPGWLDGVLAAGARDRLQPTTVPKVTSCDQT